MSHNIWKKQTTINIVSKDKDGNGNKRSKSNKGQKVNSNKDNYASISRKSFEAVQKFHGSSRFCLCHVDNNTYMLKKEDIEDEKDNIEHEYKIGIELNSYQHLTPHCVFTHKFCLNDKPFIIDKDKHYKQQQQQQQQQYNQVQSYNQHIHDDNSHDQYYNKVRSANQHRNTCGDDNCSTCHAINQDVYYISNNDYHSNNNNYNTCEKIRYLLIEYLNGETVPQDASLDDNLRALIQISACLETLSPIGFTHYNLHRDNIILLPLDHDYIINYKDFSLQTSKLVKLFDFGRSYTYRHGGYPVKRRSVRDMYFPQHDLLYFIYSVFHHNYKTEFRKLCNFYGHYNCHTASNKFLKSISIKHTYVPPTQKFVRYCIQEFGFAPIYNNNNPPTLQFNDGSVA